MTLHQRYCHQTATWNLYTRHALFKWAFFSFSFYFHIHLFILLHIFTSMMKSSVIHHIRGCVCSQNVNRIKRKVFSIKKYHHQHFSFSLTLSFSFCMRQDNPRVLHTQTFSSLLFLLFLFLSFKYTYIHLYMH